MTARGGARGAPWGVEGFMSRRACVLGGLVHRLVCLGCHSCLGALWGGGGAVLRTIGGEGVGWGVVMHSLRVSIRAIGHTGSA